MSDRTILYLGAGLLAFMLLTRRRSAQVPMVAKSPTINSMQDYWLKMAGINLAGQGISAAAKAAMSYKPSSSDMSTAANSVDGVYDSWSGGGSNDVDISEWL